MAKKDKPPTREAGAKAAAGAGLLSLLGFPLAQVASPQSRTNPMPFVPNRRDQTPPKERKK
jgi:hypothetical protein